MAELKSETVVFVRDFSPYNKGEVATFVGDELEALKNPVVYDEKNRPVKLDKIVESYDPKSKEHAELLYKQRGKVGDDATPEESGGSVNPVNFPQFGTQALQDQRNRAADAAVEVSHENAPDKGEQDVARLDGTSNPAVVSNPEAIDKKSNKS